MPSMSDIPVLTIDGPSGSGKGTLAQRMAEKLGWHYLDSGAIYRVLAQAALKHQIDLTDEAVDELTEQASASLDDAIDYFQFSKQIYNQCSAQQRIDIVELLWRLAYSDGELDPQEEYVIRRVANLLYVTHEDFIAAKLAATKL